MSKRLDYEPNRAGKADIEYQRDYNGIYNKRIFIYTVKGKHIGKDINLRFTGCRMEFHATDEVWDIHFDDILYDDLGATVEDDYLLESYMDEVLEDIIDWFNVNGGDLD